ncbi:MAG: glycosyltransferase [Chitinophagaceae bacterium]|nr:glycosyltransferase [Chitinophagaceae bacterium]
MHNRSIDIVIPTCRLNEKALLGIIHLPPPPGFKVNIYIISDNPGAIVPGSISHLHDTGKITLQVNSKNLGASAARNAGIRAGNSKWILLLDDDVHPEQNLLLVYAKAIQQNENAPGFAGVTFFPEPFNAVTKALHIHGVTSSFLLPLNNASVIWSPTANIMLNREKIDNALFDESLATAEDIDFLVRNSLRLNERYISLPEAVVHHSWWNNGKIQTKRMFDYGAGAGRLANKELIRKYTYIDFTNTPETILLLLLLYPLALMAGVGYIITGLLIIIPLSEYITNWLRAIIKGKTYSARIAFHLLWIKNCYESGFLYSTIRDLSLRGFARRIEMGFNKPHPGSFRLNRWKIIKLAVISILSLLILWRRT